MNQNGKIIQIQNGQIINFEENGFLNISEPFFENNDQIPIIIIENESGEKIVGVLIEDIVHFANHEQWFRDVTRSGFYSISIS